MRDNTMLWFIIRWLVHAIILLVVAYGGKAIGFDISIKDFTTAFLVVFILAVVNAVIRPIQKTFLLPLNCLTFGLLGFALNLLSLFLVSLAFGDAFQLGGFGSTLYCALALAVLGGMANHTIKQMRKKDR